MKILIFAVRLSAQGFGVDVVIKQLAAAWESIGYDVTVGCILSDIHSEKIEMVTEEESAVLALIEKIKPDIIYIHTFPFWQYIPAIKKKFSEISLIMHDYGDPTPELFSNKQLQEFLRRQYKIRKENRKYADRVITISEFVRTDVGYDEADVVLLGSENIPDLGTKKFVSKNKLKIGMLGRIGESENDYKGMKYFAEIVKCLQSKNFEFYFAGHGKLKDAETLTKIGIDVKVNLSESEKTDYLRDLDIFISTSLWEGFNLPLLEAQGLATLSLCFDTGAHPEVTIFNFASMYEMIAFIEKMDQRRDLLLKYSNQCYAFSRSNFSWLKGAMRILSFNSQKSSVWTDSVYNLGKQRKIDLPYFKLIIKFIQERGLIYFITYGFNKLFKLKGKK